LKLSNTRWEPRQNYVIDASIKKWQFWRWAGAHQLRIARNISLLLAHASRGGLRKSPRLPMPGKFPVFLPRIFL
jgi:hypothetical protein